MSFEHDLELAADLTTVLDYGQRIAVGPPAQALGDPRVIDAYPGPDFAVRVVTDRRGDPT